MLEVRRDYSYFDATINTLRLIRIRAVRETRLGQGFSAYGFLKQIAMQIGMIFAFYLIFFGLRGGGITVIRGDMVLFLLTGFNLFMQHNGVISQSQRAAAMTEPVMLHAPVNFFVDVLGRNLATLYLHFVVFWIIIVLNVVVLDGAWPYKPWSLLPPILLSWSSAMSIGLLFRTLVWFIPPISMLTNFYRRFNMISSGKMVPVNVMAVAGFPMWLFSWNPLFHCIDQARGAAFENYTPHYTNLMYPLKVTLVLGAIGILGEGYKRMYKRGY